MSPVKLAFVIPTRNRPAMAMTAVRHLCGQDGGDIAIFVFDNSKSAADAARLADFCGKLGDPRVTYVRSPADLSQGRHWDYALRQALARSDVTHVTIHYDRKIMRPEAAGILCGVAARHPGQVVTYLTDSITHLPPPRRLWQVVWTGALYRLETARIVEASAAGEALEIGNQLPILSNCLVPRAVAEALVERFGTLCESTTADSCFTYRFCALFDDFLHLDRPLSILYGSHRSAGIGYLSGGGSGDFADYRQTWQGEAWLDAAIVPGLNLGYNMLFHEYELVRRHQAGSRLPPLDREACLRDLGRGLTWIGDPKRREATRAVLLEHGWDGRSADGGVPRPLPLWKRFAWRAHQSVTLLRADWLGATPATITGFGFASDRRALRYGLKYPRRATESAAHLDRVAPVEIEPPQG